MRAALEPADDAVPSRVAELSNELEGWDAERILKDAAEAFPDMVVTSSFGADSIVLLHLVHLTVPTVPVLFLDTDFHFSETLAYRREVAKRFSLNIVDVRPDALVRQEFRMFGDAIPFGDPDTCCHLRKTLPLRNALNDVSAWATGIRRSTTANRQHTPVVQALREGGRWRAKIAPLVAWTDDDIEQYIGRHHLPRHALVERGYRSIGCRPCTRPVRDGENPRDGRWANAPEKTECGLHLDWDDETSTPRTTAP